MENININKIINDMVMGKVLELKGQFRNAVASWTGEVWSIKGSIAHCKYDDGMISQHSILDLDAILISKFPLATKVEVRHNYPIMFLSEKDLYNYLECDKYDIKIIDDHIADFLGCEGSVSVDNMHTEPDTITTISLSDKEIKLGITSYYNKDEDITEYIQWLYDIN